MKHLNFSCVTPTVSVTSTGYFLNWQPRPKSQLDLHPPDGPRRVEIMFIFNNSSSIHFNHTIYSALREFDPFYKIFDNCQLNKSAARFDRNFNIYILFISFIQDSNTIFEWRLTQSPRNTASNVSDVISHGRLEVRRQYGQWGTVCIPRSSFTVANMICRHFGFVQALQHNNVYLLPVGTVTPIHMKLLTSTLSRFESDDSLDYLSFSLWDEETGCDHSQDGGVMCLRGM